MKPFTSLQNVLSNCLRILRNERTAKEKTAILGTYVRLLWTYAFPVCLLKKKIQKEKLFGNTVYFFDYDIFLWLFYEIFIRKEYFFSTDKKNPTILDCGSNIGISVLFFKKMFPDAEILCFEPEEETAGLLKKNVEENKLGGITIYKAAVSNKEGEIAFYVDKEKKGVLAMSTTKQGEEHGVFVKEIKVSATKLSKYITKQIDFLKLDVEGAESEVLQELADQEKLAYIKKMVVEYHYSKKNPKNKISKILNILEGNKFQVIINSEQKPPFEEHEEKPYNLLIYAYKRE